MRLITVQFPPVFCYFVPLRPRIILLYNESKFRKRVKLPTHNHIVLKLKMCTNLHLCNMCASVTSAALFKSLAQKYVRHCIYEPVIIKGTT